MAYRPQTNDRKFQWVFKGSESRRVRRRDTARFLDMGFSLGRPTNPNAMTALERCRNHRDRKRVAGLCLRCSSPAVQGAGLCETHRELCNRKSKERHALLKAKVIAGYGGRCQCVGCEETRFEFLTIDHTNNDGGITTDQQKQRNRVCFVQAINRQWIS